MTQPPETSQTRRPNALRRAGRPGVACLAVLLALPVAAHAQLSVGGGGGAPKGATTPDGEKKLAPPPAIPGAVSNNAAAPATKPASEMDPNAALFDAIDRGDFAAARDALNRGADLNARNVLGQRPVDMSIDLSRNDITFLLLSLRAQNGDQAPAASSGTEEAAAETPAPAPPTRADRRHRGRAAAPPPALDAEVSSKAPASSDPGFLGFGGR